MRLQRETEDTCVRVMTCFICVRLHWCNRHTICVAVVNRVREKEMQMATCKDSRGKFKESDILPFAFLFGRRGGPRARLFGGQLIELFYRSHKTHMRRGVLCPTDQIRLLISGSFAGYFTRAASWLRTRWRARLDWHERATGGGGAARRAARGRVCAQRRRRRMEGGRAGHSDVDAGWGQATADGPRGGGALRQAVGQRRPAK